ncbi:hypothetical protein CDAR_81061 [Caerostris darwini]|uniref:Uncharacterized protein n=1 Tax=Caerostris darwini TaxID=1538125 RepID=A0AAV4VS70_9ARAC|nr:hypothetical protein CDAR_81061 [Caerostris darwini]
MPTPRPSLRLISSESSDCYGFSHYEGSELRKLCIRLLDVRMWDSMHYSCAMTEQEFAQGQCSLEHFELHASSLQHLAYFLFVLHPERTPYFNCLSLNKAVTFSHHVHGSGSSVAYLQYRRGNPSRPPSKGVTFSHQVHGSGSSLAYLQYRRDTPPRWRRYWNCAVCAHNTAFVGRPLLNGESVLLRMITNKSLGFLAACKLLTITCTEI